MLRVLGLPRYSFAMNKYGAVLLVIILPLAVANTAASAPLIKYKNCAAVNKVFSHGIAKVGYKKTASGLTGTPFVSNALYKLNSAKDRDGDGVACEK